VEFPAPDVDEPPAWLPWDRSKWHEHRETWFSQVNEMLNADLYLERIFETETKIKGAKGDVEKTRAYYDAVGNAILEPVCFSSVATAESWLKRLEQWESNLRRDLYADCIPAPDGSDRQWMLYRSPETQVSATTKAISCNLCKCCRLAFSNTCGKGGAPDVRMPAVARANGLWHGPDPEELSDLSYCETKVINLARIYVSVKRVFLDCASYARTNAAEAPLYHQKNVVAYPQNPDAALRHFGMSPAVLAEMVHVQFVGENRARLHGQQELWVSVKRLRRAFRWLTLNSFPFMEQTKHHALWEGGQLDEGLENLLELYRRSVGSESGGVPAELFHGASQIDQRHGNVNVIGPADCIPGDDETKSEDVAEQAENPNDNCAGIIDGGVDTIKPIQIWDSLMKKYL